MSEAGNLYQAPESNVETDSEGGFDDNPLFSPKGRLGRLRFITLSMLVGIVGLVIMSLVSVAVVALLGDDSEGIAASVMVILWLVTFIPGLILTIKRFHDLNSSGWFSITMLIPLVNLIALIALWFVPGTKGKNKYGLEPKPGNTALSVIVIVFMLTMWIGIFAAIAIPAYQDYLEAANQQQQEQQQQ